MQFNLPFVAAFIAFPQNPTTLLSLFVFVSADAPTSIRLTMTIGELKKASTSMSKVQHGYRDHALVTEDPKLSCHQSKNKFPVKLHLMLSELNKDGLSHIVSWQPHGRCFLVHKQEEFVKRILPL